MQDTINALARTTGSYPVSSGKSARGYVHVKDKFSCANLTSLPSTSSSTPPGIAEYPVVMEAGLVSEHSLFKGQSTKSAVVSFELHISRIRVKTDLKVGGHRNRIDMNRWKPMIIMFSELYGLRDGKATNSVLAGIKELYRSFTGTTG